MMRRRRYDQYQQHQADHERLLDEIREIADAFEATEQLDDSELTARLADWFQVHFKTHDARLHKMTSLVEPTLQQLSPLKSLIKHVTQKFIGR